MNEYRTTIYAVKLKNMQAIKWVILFLILSGLISFASGSELSQLQWVQGVSGKLHRGEVLSYNGYSVEAVDFPMPVRSDKYKAEPEEPVQPFVGLNVSKNGSFIGTVVLGSGESYITPDSELQVTVTALPSQSAIEWLYESYSPWATIELDARGIPNINVLIDTNNDNYISLSDTDIVATVELENTGSADAINVDMNVATELPVTRGSLKYHYDTIKKGDSITETITFRPPYVLEQKDYDILANVTWYDVTDMFYTEKYQKTVTIAPEPKDTSLSISKSVDSKIYLGDNAMVSISLKNHIKDDLNNISVTDSLPDGFKPIGNTTLHWIANIPAGGDWDIHYLIKPQESNIDGVELPSAVAEFTIEKENYSIQSNQPKIIVYGPKIVLTKQADVSGMNPDETVTVTVAAENTGSTPTEVLIKDVLPENAIIISGNTMYEAFLESNKKVSFNYSIRIGASPPIRLPPATANYFEPGNKGGQISTVSQEPIITGTKKVPEEILPEPTPEETTPEPTHEPTPEPTSEINVTVPAINESSGNSTSSNNNKQEINDILNFLFGCDTNSSSVSPKIKNRFCMEEKK
ncbi:MAG: hypothetical protein O8C56_12100 [Candidatus Methanoperedens sp.]|nr:hypothetical protein [Candidatus Methanoperedens sp.]